MSQPPRYKPEFRDEEEAVGLLGGGDDPHSYPPSATPATAPGSAGKSVVYHLRPNWPVSKDLQEQDAVSVIGRNRAESVQLVLSAFPELRAYDEDRINFLMPSDPLTAITWSTKYARITEPAWAGLTASMIRVELADMPGDALARKKHETRRKLIIFGTFIGGPFLILIALLVAVALLSDS